ncbi:hypothetical protein TRFO_23205 [Tritrichomonas foetus]|uniref:Transmembrane protein n=1 Tax=Tritrichomonas foetus TaxID=1144522 RepID=A0A1J4KG80_9EUKA|nr:hypothetical protein TRFO_23205 [Tritrichomonas foetus]|eukprot:OHT08365.1 hypothetical protein TRFO_23205 [Tritrichomonas foetus]
MNISISALILFSLCSKDNNFGISIPSFVQLHSFQISKSRFSKSFTPIIYSNCAIHNLLVSQVHFNNILNHAIHLSDHIFSPLVFSDKNGSNGFVFSDSDIFSCVISNCYFWQCKPTDPSSPEGSAIRAIQKNRDISIIHCLFSECYSDCGVIRLKEQHFVNLSSNCFYRCDKTQYSQELLYGNIIYLTQIVKVQLTELSVKSCFKIYLSLCSGLYIAGINYSNSYKSTNAIKMVQILHSKCQFMNFFANRLENVLYLEQLYINPLSKIFKLEYSNFIDNKINPGPLNLVENYLIYIIYVRIIMTNCYFQNNETKIVNLKNKVHFISCNFSNEIYTSELLICENCIFHVDSMKETVEKNISNDENCIFYPFVFPNSNEGQQKMNLRKQIIFLYTICVLLFLILLITSYLTFYYRKLLHAFYDNLSDIKSQDEKLNDENNTLVSMITSFSSDNYEYNENDDSDLNFVSSGNNA